MQHCHPTSLRTLWMQLSSSCQPPHSPALVQFLCCWRQKKALRSHSKSNQILLLCPNTWWAWICFKLLWHWCTSLFFLPFFPSHLYSNYLNNSSSISPSKQCKFAVLQHSWGNKFKCILRLAARRDWYSSVLPCLFVLPHSVIQLC